jgi:hypothetical protein
VSSDLGVLDARHLTEGALLRKYVEDQGIKRDR